MQDLLKNHLRDELQNDETKEIESELILLSTYYLLVTRGTRNEQNALPFRAFGLGGQQRCTYK